MNIFHIFFELLRMLLVVLFAAFASFAVYVCAPLEPNMRTAAAVALLAGMLLPLILCKTWRGVFGISGTLFVAFLFWYLIFPRYSGHRF